MIEYACKSQLPQEQVLRLYQACGWTNYTRNPETLLAAINNSLCVITAWHEDVLVGLVEQLEMLILSCIFRISWCCQSTDAGA